MFMPGGQALAAGTRLRQPAYGKALKAIASEGASALYGGALGEALTALMARDGGLVSQADLTAYQVAEREPIRSSYRGYDIYGPPPPASAGVHIAQMLNVLEGYDQVTALKAGLQLFPVGRLHIGP